MCRFVFGEAFSIFVSVEIVKFLSLKRQNKEEYLLVSF